jgi:hypothetical protein
MTCVVASLDWIFGRSGAIDEDPGGGDRAPAIEVQVPHARDLHDRAIEADVAGWLETRDLMWSGLARRTWFGPDDRDTTSLKGQFGAFGERLKQRDRLRRRNCAR